MDNMVSQGIQLALFGMGTVFVFLTILIGATWVMSRLVLRFAPISVASDVNTTVGPSDASAAADAELVAVISAAIHQFNTANKP